MPAAAMVGAVGRGVDTIVLGSHLQLRVSPMTGDAIERRFSWLDVGLFWKGLARIAASGRERAGAQRDRCKRWTARPANCSKSGPTAGGRPRTTLRQQQPHARPLSMPRYSVGPLASFDGLTTSIVQDLTTSVPWQEIGSDFP
ncbi:MAG: hypothetical protein QOF56_4346 [Acidobacteriaceae bacterium]|nr:hypothetical protein [Acidobacteriaceae bacterium]